MVAERPPSDPQIEAQLKSAQIRKLELESRLLESQLSSSHQRLEALKAIAAGSGLILATVAVIGGLASVFAWFANDGRDRELRTQERLERVLGGLTGTTPEQRITSATALAFFFTKGHASRNTQIATSLINALSLENSTIVRTTILSVLHSTNAEVIGQPTLNEVISALTRHSRVLMKESGLSAGLGDEDIWGKGLTAQHGAALAAIAEAIAVFLRKGARTKDLSGTYLVRQDLSGLSLEGVSFDASILAGSNFNGAKLRGSSFAGSHLESTHFIQADLRQVKFEGSRNDLPMRPYISRLANLKHQGAGIYSSVEMPDFSCADLRGAVFAGHLLFAFVSDEAAKTLGYYDWPVKLSGANISGANFKRMGRASVTHDKEQAGTPFAGCCGGEGFEIKEGVHLNYYHPDDDSGLEESLKNFGITADGFVSTFQGSNWPSAVLPVWLKEFLERNKVSSVYTIQDGHCRPRVSWINLQAK